MEVGCFATVAMAPGSSLYCSGPEPAGGDGCGVSGVATERKTKLEEGPDSAGVSPRLCRVRV